MWLTRGPSGDDLLDRSAFFDQAHGSSKAFDFHLLMVKPELMKNRGVQVAIVMWRIDGLVADFVRAAVNYAALDAAASHP